MNTMESGYAILIFLAAALLVFSHLRPDLVASPSRLIDSAMHRRATRLGVVIFWWWLAWHFLAVK